MTDKNKQEIEEEVDACVVGNEVFFYTYIDDDTILWLHRELRNLETKLLKKKAKNPGVSPKIILYLKSDGGDMFAGMSGMDFISNMRVPVYTVADGICASAATFLLFGGTKRYVKSHAHVLIHQLSTDGFWGKFEDLKDEMKSLKKFMKMIKGVYENRANIPQKKMDSLMKKDVYLDARQCLKYQIVDDVFSSGCL